MAYCFQYPNDAYPVRALTATNYEPSCCLDSTPLNQRTPQEDR